MIQSSELREAIRRRAEEIYIESGRIPGRDLENWTQAETEILHKTSGRRSAIVVEVNGTQIVGEYKLDACGGYQPGEFSVGEDVSIRFDRAAMFIKRKNGTELETAITPLT